MKEILLINPKSGHPPPSYFGPPYGLALIAAVLEKNKRTPICLDLEDESSEGMINKAKLAIINNKIKYVGVTCQAGNRGYAYKLVKEIKKIDQDLIIILGGPFSTAKYDIILKNFPVDFIIFDEGIITFSKLIECLDKGGDVSNVKGIGYIDNSKIIKTSERKRIKNIDKLPFPAFYLFDVKERIRGKNSFLFNEAAKKGIKLPNEKSITEIQNALMLLSSFGCIYSCSFCQQSKISKEKYRAHSPEYFMDMIQFFKQKYSCSCFIFGDSLFTKDAERTKKICKGIKERGINIKWGCMTRTDHVDEELIKKMKEAGCIEIAFGVESCSEKVQKATGKNLDLTTVKTAFNLCNKHGIRGVLLLMVGNQGETKETIYETLSRIRNLEPDEVILSITKAYPPSRIHDILEKNGVIPKNFYLNEECESAIFTAENQLPEIKKWMNMFKLRDLRIAIQDSCNNNCIHCENGKGKIKTTKEIKDEILKFAKRCYSVTFCLKEPAIRDDITELIGYARELGINNIQIETNARIFSYERKAEEFSRLTINKFIVPLFSQDKELHERITRTKGSFEQTCKGIKNLIKYKGGVIASIRIFKLNLSNLEKTVDLALSLGIDEFEFIYEPNQNMKIPSIDEIKPIIERILHKLASLGKKFSIMGIPYCILPEYGDAIDEIHHPFDELLTLDNKLINQGKERRKNKSKTERCKNCKHYYICEGIWKNYIKIYGEEEFPLKKC